MKDKQLPAFVVSLDLELFWGVHDIKSYDGYRINLLGVKNAIPEILKLFEKYRIHATWATVGMLFCRNKEELIEMMPQILPSYSIRESCPYLKFEKIDQSDADDSFYFAPSIIKTISAYPYQEIGSHTFSHFNTEDKLHRAIEFEHDIDSAIKVARKRGYDIKSIVFPRNKFSQEKVAILKKMGIVSYRGNNIKSIAREVNYSSKFKTRVNKLFRLINTYFNISGDNSFSLNSIRQNVPLDIPSSRFLRQYNSRLSFLEGLKLKRIKKEMTKAAVKGNAYHLWWHPHNFGSFTDKNLSILEEILKHYCYLNKHNGMTSMNMSDVAEYVLSGGKNVS